MNTVIVTKEGIVHPEEGKDPSIFYEDQPVNDFIGTVSKQPTPINANNGPNPSTSCTILNVPITRIAN